MVFNGKIHFAISWKNYVVNIRDLVFGCILKFLEDFVVFDHPTRKFGCPTCFLTWARNKWLGPVLQSPIVSYKQMPQNLLEIFDIYEKTKPNVVTCTWTFIPSRQTANRQKKVLHIATCRDPEGQIKAKQRPSQWKHKSARSDT